MGLVFLCGNSLAFARFFPFLALDIQTVSVFAQSTQRDSARKTRKKRNSLRLGEKDRWGKARRGLQGSCVAVMEEGNPDLSAGTVNSLNLRDCADPRAIQLLRKRPWRCVVNRKIAPVMGRGMVCRARTSGGARALQG